MEGGDIRGEKSKQEQIAALSVRNDEEVGDRVGDSKGKEEINIGILQKVGKTCIADGMRARKVR